MCDLNTAFMFLVILRISHNHYKVFMITICLTSSNIIVINASVSSFLHLIGITMVFDNVLNIFFSINRVLDE